MSLLVTFLSVYFIYIPYGSCAWGGGEDSGGSCARGGGEDSGGSLKSDLRYLY